MITVKTANACRAAEVTIPNADGFTVGELHTVMIAAWTKNRDSNRGQVFILDLLLNCTQHFASPQIHRSLAGPP